MRKNLNLDKAMKKVLKKVAFAVACFLAVNVGAFTGFVAATLYGRL
jgi:hypothetical protein